MIFQEPPFQTICKDSSRLVPVLQAIEAVAAAENMTHHGSKTPVILRIRDSAKIKQVFTGNEFMYSNLINVAIFIYW